MKSISKLLENSEYRSDRGVDYSYVSLRITSCLPTEPDGHVAISGYISGELLGPPNLVLIPTDCEQWNSVEVVSFGEEERDPLLLTIVIREDLVDMLWGIVEQEWILRATSNKTALH